MSRKSTGSDSGEEEDVLQFKLVILGDGAVGKTSLCMRFSEDSFAKRWTEKCLLQVLLHSGKVCKTACSYKQTIGVDFFLKQLTLPGNKRVAVQVCR